MKALTWSYVKELLDAKNPPCISMFLPTHRRHTETVKDRTTFRNLLKKVELSLQEKYPTREIRPLLQPFHKLEEDAKFWEHNLDGLAVLGAPDRFDVFRLQRPLHELAVVADTFHIKPLIRYLQSADRYQVLCLNRDRMRLAEGNRYGLDWLDLTNVPSTLTQALGDQVTEPVRSAASTGGKAGTSLHYGQGSRKDEIDNDTERFFRFVDREVFSRFSKPSGLPLVLASLAEHQSVFRKLSHNNHLLPKGVTINPDALDLEHLAKQVWEVVEPQYLARLKKLSDDFTSAQAHSKGSADLSDIARNAIAGRISVLLVEAFRNLPGRLDTATGAIKDDRLGHPEVDDLIDDVAEEVLRRGGEVIVVPADRMPTTSGLAATFRF